MMKNPSYGEIERNWAVSKLLLSQGVESRMVAFNLGQCNIFLEALYCLRTSLQCRDAILPFIATVRSQSTQEPINFIKRFPEYRGHKIFKHANGFRHGEDYYGLATNVVKNMLGLRPNKIFYISSDNLELRQFFYSTAVRFNKENDFGCSFDYDDYDYKLTVKKYDIVGKFGCVISYSVVTYLEGQDMPNSWNSEFKTP